jgi:hypothetical protein
MVYINNKRLDYVNAKRQQGVVPGCAAMQDEEPIRRDAAAAAAVQSTLITKVVKETKDICKDNRCQNGRCIPSKNGKEYVCRCIAGKFNQITIKVQ